VLDNRPVYLIIVGDGPLNQRLGCYAEQLGITKRVRWTGWQRDAGIFQELADLIVCPSRHEPLGNVILEAWARHRPVLATRTLGPAEIAVHQEDAWLTPVGDPGALATAMELLLQNDLLRCELAEQGYRTLVARHGEEVIVNAYLDLYRHLVEA
jgi:glycosyltransferase involved in cell wall biosynthesis